MSRLFPLVSSLALSVGLFAGCLDGDGADLAPALSQLADLDKVLDLTHDIDGGHTVPSLHERASPNMELVSFHSLAGVGVDWVDGNGDVVVHEGYAYVATFGLTSGFVILDVSDPATPTVVGRYANPNSDPADIMLSDDGRWVLLSTHPMSTLASHLPREANVLPMRLPDPLAYTEENHRTGVSLVDVTDKTVPALAAFYANEPDGTHNTDYAKIGEREFIFTIDRSRVTVLEITSTPDGWALVPVSLITADDYWRGNLPSQIGNTYPFAYFPPGGHDVVYEQHPLTSDHLLHIAFGPAGYAIYNINDINRPARTSNWRELPDAGYYHYALPVDILIDDYHVTVVAPELYNSDETTGTLAILDTSAPREPSLLGTWKLPGDLFIESNYRFSPHNFAFRNGTMFLGSYHAGVWAVDLACAGCLFEPEVTGYYLPHHDTDRIVDGERQCLLWCESPFVWAVVVDDAGLLYASDVETGLYILRYTPLAEASA